MQNKPSVCIIGLGKMGNFFYRELTRLGYAVFVFDKGERLNTDIFKKTEIILLCVPIGALKSALEDVMPFLESARHILSDITSVKVYPMDYMQEVFDGSVVGTHPLFGPDPDPSDMKAIIVPGKGADEQACKAIERLYIDMGCSVFRSGAREHDHGVGVAQSLNFAVSAAFFSLLARKEGIRHFLTPSFKRHLEAARKHLTTDKEMFCEFTAQNPEFNGALEEYRGIVNEMLQGDLKKISDEAAIWYNNYSLYLG
ncbi:MAG: prephenate dehydrogenase/arogenate dehydrogenase family protein [Deferribacteraceae bacterium]|jgi:prephenate dehydrogenase|nr:prephenate dehydrogenase/arogenate dehydrogenase family protein [Deferribacteraceae bacterium]